MERKRKRGVDQAIYIYIYLASLQTEKRIAMNHSEIMRLFYEAVGIVNGGQGAPGYMIKVQDSHCSIASMGNPF